MKKTSPLAGARWIAPDAVCETPIILRRFTAAASDAATLTITGLGYFEARINGSPVTDARFLPVASDYERRDFTKITYPCRDSFTHRIYYCVFDVTALLRDGENLLEIELGNGWYRQTERVAEGEMSYGSTLKAVYRLDVGEKTLLSDGSETWRASEIVYSNLFTGEVHDPAAVTDLERPVQTLPPPEAELSAQIGVPDRVARTIRPRLIGEKDGRKIFDAGENVSGVVAVTAKRKGVVTLRFAENLRGGELDFSSTGYHYRCTSGVQQIMTDRFVCDGVREVWEPRFVWHCFRYFDVEGDFDALTVKVIHSDTPVTSCFSSDSEGLQFLYDAFVRTQLDNMHGSFPSDCPHRERLGYTGDGQACAEAGMLMLDAKEFYRKWIRDILDCQSKNGHVQHTAPFQGGGGGPGGWGCAIVIVPYIYYKEYGDIALVSECFAPMRRWIDYLRAHMEDGLVTSEEEGGWCLGDWCTLEKCVIPEAFVNSWYLVKSLRMMCELAAVLGEPSEDLTELDAAVCSAIRRHFYADGHFCGGIQGADAYAIDLDLGGDVDALAEKYDALGHFDTGFLGTGVLLDVLFATNHADTALRLLESEEPGSYLYMKRRGATTIWEHWTGASSHCHPMFGGTARHLFTSILGIGQAAGSTGYRDIVIAPRVPSGLTAASGSILTEAGRIGVSLKRGADGFAITVTLPEDKTARLCWHGQEYLLIGRETTLLF